MRATGPSGDRRFYGALLETNGSQETVFYFAGPIRIATRSAATGVRFYHHDHLGSVRLLTNATGAAVGSYDFLPYGKKTAGAGSPDPVWDFAGHRTDADTGLVYMNARYYDPEIGRFLSANTIVPDPNNRSRSTATPTSTTTRSRTSTRRATVRPLDT